MRTILLTLLFSAFFIKTKAQNTTQEEFNYMSKGFSRMINEGLDLKKGYYLADTLAFTIDYDKYHFVYFNLRRISNKTLAGTIVIVKSNTSNKTYYIGIPAAASNKSIDLGHVLVTQMSNYYWDSNIKNAFLVSLAEYMMLRNTFKS